MEIMLIHYKQIRWKETIIIIVHWQGLVRFAHHLVNALDQVNKHVAPENVYVTQDFIKVMLRHVRLHLLGTFHRLEDYVHRQIMFVPVVLAGLTTGMGLLGFVPI